MKPTKKPANFDVRTASGICLYCSSLHRLNIRVICLHLQNAAKYYSEEVSLINTVTRNSWTVTPEGRWF